MRTADALVQEACDACGLDDPGPPGWREGLEVLVWSLREEAGLSEVGDAALESQVLRFVENRLRVRDWAARHPEVPAAPVERPLVVLGLPRTGTTLLSYLLDRDPARRSLLRWEALDPVPPPEPATRRHGPRVDAARAGNDALYTLEPRLEAIHHEEPAGPTECVTLLAQAGQSLLFETLANVPTYGRWLLEADQGAGYAHHRLALQVLQSRVPGVWSLKSPHHCLALDALVSTYPDARLVMTHRDPVQVVASTCSLVRTFTATFSDVDHGSYVNDHWTDVLHECVSRVEAYRAAHGDDRFVDVAYDELVVDPIATMRHLYEQLGDELTPATEAAMRAHVAESPKGARGTHDYSPDSLGLDARALADRFATYSERFDVAPEAPRL